MPVDGLDSPAVKYMVPRSPVYPQVDSYIVSLGPLLARAYAYVLTLHR
jgi:hypothetical protein